MECFKFNLKREKMAQSVLPIQYINPPALFTPPGFSHVVEVTGGRTIYIAGQVAFDSSFQLVGQGDFRAQAEQIFENMKTALDSVGADFNQLVRINIYLVDMTKLPIFMEVRDRYVNTQHPPASTAIEVRKLAREGLLLEVDGIAWIPE
jgi:enamine deaminase RidA (YjgF/YER057c/UK114 family)